MASRIRIHPRRIDSFGTGTTTDQFRIQNVAHPKVVVVLLGDVVIVVLILFRVRIDERLTTIANLPVAPRSVLRRHPSRAATG